MIALVTLSLLLAGPDDQVGRLLYECQELARATNLGVSGAYVYRIRTGSHGEVSTVSLVSDTVHSRVMDRCLRHGLLGVVMQRKSATFNVKLEVPRAVRQHAVWLNNVPMIRTIAKDVSVRPLVYRENTGMDVYPLAVAKLNAGGELPPHFHVSSGMFLYVLDGSVKLSWQHRRGSKGVKSRVLKKGASAWIPAGAVHSLRSDSDVVVAIFFEKSNDFNWLRGISSPGTRILPPPSVPMTGPAPSLEAGRLVKIHAPVVALGGRRVKRRKLISRGTLTLELVYAPKGRDVKIAGGPFTAFVLSGGGSITADSDESEVMRGGSGIAALRLLKFRSVTRNIPFSAVVLHRGRLSLSVVPARRAGSGRRK